MFVATGFDVDGCHHAHNRSFLTPLSVSWRQNSQNHSRMMSLVAHSPSFKKVQRYVVRSSSLGALWALTYVRAPSFAIGNEFNPKRSLLSSVNHDRNSCKRHMQSREPRPSKIKLPHSGSSWIRQQIPNQSRIDAIAFQSKVAVLLMGFPTDCL
jgi:hypothetical protein